ncbi:MAG: class I SAM-dependent methyltransferase [Pseudomonadota bacterium]
MPTAEVLTEHLGYVSDAHRLQAFREACAATINTGNRVLDAGAGVGILGLLSLEAGAGSVHCVEAGAIINIAEEMFSKSGFADRVSFSRCRLEDCEPEALADVAICDHVGYFGFDYGIVQLAREIRRAHLEPGGTIIPRSIELEIAAVSSPRLSAMSDGWDQAGVPDAFHSLIDLARNQKYAAAVSQDELASRPSQLGQIDLRTEDSDFFSWETELEVTRNGTIHGLAGWFRCELAEGIYMTNSPLAENRLNRRQAYLPVEPFKASAGQTLSISVVARPGDEIIAWDVKGPNGFSRSHSTWQGMLSSAADTGRTAPDFVPSLSAKGRLEREILNLCDGKKTIQEIEQLLFEQFLDKPFDASTIRNAVAKHLQQADNQPR